jgi:hypothetical protein
MWASADYTLPVGVSFEAGAGASREVPSSSWQSTKHHTVCRVLA